jgi:hypothetical protein
MLYQLGKTNDTFNSITPRPFEALPLERGLEDLLAKNLLDVLFENNGFMPIFQERPYQNEADIYALNQEADLVIFELKKNMASGGAVHQVLGYCEKASHFKYQKLQDMYRKYKQKNDLDLQEDHRAAFDISRALDQSAFNQKQRLFVVGNAGDEQLISNVDYWKAQGLLLKFIPYRVYKIGVESYFEFFSPPYDQHSNPAYAKGVIFDTNQTYGKDESIWYMCEKNRVAAFGEQMGIVHYLGKNDIVFLYHAGQGIIGAGKVITNKVAKDDDAEALYHGLEWLTAKPTRSVRYDSLPAWKIKEVLDHNFYWATTIKRPYLTLDESNKLLTALINVIGPKP